MKKLFISLILLCSWSAQTLADATQDRRLLISVSIFPRIVAVDENMNNKLDDDSVHLAVVFSSDRDKAKDIAQKMTRKISNIGGHKIIIELVDSKDLSSLDSKIIAGALLVEPLDESALRTANNYFSSRSVLFFSPFEGDVENGTMSSIFIGARIQPYFNLRSINRAGIKLKPAIMGVSKLYE